MTLAVVGAVRGRPVTTLQGTQRALERARAVNHDLRSRLLAERQEGVLFATEVRARALRVHLATTAERPDLAAQEAAAITVAADRRLRQLGDAS